MSDKKETYPWRLQCSNCRKIQAVHIPKGESITSYSFAIHHSRKDRITCKNCGCDQWQDMGPPVTISTGGRFSA